MTGTSRGPGANNPMCLAGHSEIDLTVHWMFQQLKNETAWTSRSGRGNPWKGKGQRHPLPAPCNRRDARRRCTVVSSHRSLPPYRLSRKVSTFFQLLSYATFLMAGPALDHPDLCDKKCSFLGNSCESNSSFKITYHSLLLRSEINILSFSLRPQVEPLSAAPLRRTRLKVSHRHFQRFLSARIPYDSLPHSYQRNRHVLRKRMESAVTFSGDVRRNPRINGRTRSALVSWRPPSR